MDPIREANSMVNRALKAYMEEPEETTAKFYFEQLETSRVLSFFAATHTIIIKSAILFW